MVTGLRHHLCAAFYCCTCAALSSNKRKTSRHVHSNVMSLWAGSHYGDLMRWAVMNLSCGAGRGLDLFGIPWRWTRSQQHLVGRSYFQTHLTLESVVWKGVSLWCFQMTNCALDFGANSHHVGRTGGSLLARGLDASLFMSQSWMKNASAKRNVPTEQSASGFLTTV